MTQPAVHDTFTLERSYRKSAAAVFAAFADPATKRRWYAEGEGHELDGFEMEFRVGGIERAAYRMGAATPFPGTPLIAEGHYEDIVDDARVVISSTMSLGGRRISTAIATFELFEDSGTTRLVLTHQAAFYEGADGPDMRRMGWEKLLDRLTAKVES
jgi:uncharacterized protein YndB with AHSA1/START domain